MENRDVEDAVLKLTDKYEVDRDTVITDYKAEINRLRQDASIHEYIPILVINLLKTQYNKKYKVKYKKGKLSVKYDKVKVTLKSTSKKEKRYLKLLYKMLKFIRKQIKYQLD